MNRKPPAKPPAKKKMGRPSKYTEELANRICQRIASGDSMRTISASPGMPNHETVRDWLVANRDFSAQYARAREEQADFYADEMVDIADTTNDPHKARLQIDARKWKASKMAPKRYGDKLDITTRDETPPVSRESMVSMMRSSAAFLAEVESMVAEAKTPLP